MEDYSMPAVCQNKSLFDVMHGHCAVSEVGLTKAKSYFMKDRMLVA